MKILLSLLGTLTLPSISLIPNLIQNDQTKQNIFFSQNTYNWNKDESSVKFYNEYVKGDSKTFFFYREMSLGMDVDWEAAESWSIWDPNDESITQVGWGNTPYYGKKLGDYQNISIDKMNEIDILLSGNDEMQKNAIKDLAKERLQIVTERWGLAYMESVTNFGTSHFVRDAEDFVAIFGYRTIYTTTTFSGGSLTLNIGKGMKINFDN